MITANRRASATIAFLIATEAYLKAMVAEPFEVFTFSPASASVYQLGTFGTARKELKVLELKP